jgi:hypothetical protein
VDIATLYSAVSYGYLTFFLNALATFRIKVTSWFIVAAFYCNLSTVFVYASAFLKLSSAPFLISFASLDFWFAHCFTPFAFLCTASTAAIKKAGLRFTKAGVLKTQAITSDHGILGIYQGTLTDYIFGLESSSSGF